MSEKYNYTDEEIKKKKQQMYESMNRSAEEQARKEQALSVKKEYGLERKAIDETTDDELLAAIKNKLDQKYGELKQGAVDDSAKKRYTFNEQIKKAEADAKSKAVSAEQRYGQAIKDVENDALKRGIARSSIANGGVALLEKDKNKLLTSIERSKNDEQAELIKKINDLEEQLEAALASYDGKRAVEEEDQFATAKKERDKANNDAIEYNNKVTQAETEYADNVAKKTVDNGLDALTKSYEVARMNDVVNFYRSFEDKDKALSDFLSDEKWKDYLGNYYPIAFRLISAG